MDLINLFWASVWLMLTMMLIIEIIRGLKRDIPDLVKWIKGMKKHDQ